MNQQKYNNQLMNKLSLTNPKGIITENCRKNMHHTHQQQQKTVNLISDPRLALQGPPAYRVITKQ